MLDWTALQTRHDELEAARALLADEHSRGVLDAFVSFCRDLDDSGFPTVTPSPYFPEDLPRWAPSLRMIDCGAFDGDSVVAACRNGYRIDASISFEPDPRSFELLSTRIRSIPGAMALPCGVCDRTETKLFASQGDTGSALSTSGNLAVQCIALDEAMPHFAPNLIKLDIEGSEEAALRGAEHLIRRSRPGLAVSVYHLPSDIWRIPLLLSEYLDGRARFYLRRHSRTIADTVLYVFPE
jgi:FkbM family methyltransferase